MADFFGDLGKKITEVADDIGRMAGDTIETQKIKSQIRSLKRANDKDNMDIGRMLYEEFQIILQSVKRLKNERKRLKEKRQNWKGSKRLNYDIDDIYEYISCSGMC